MDGIIFAISAAEYERTPGSAALMTPEEARAQLVPWFYMRLLSGICCRQHVTYSAELMPGHGFIGINADMTAWL